MSGIDKLRSFAQARPANHELIRDGLTYRDARDALREFREARNAALEEAARVCEVGASIRRTYCNAAVSRALHDRARRIRALKSQEPSRLIAALDAEPPR